MKDLKSVIRNVPDFPKKGIGFKDITTLLQDSEAFDQAVDEMCEPYKNRKIDIVAGIEARGFIFGGAMAVNLKAGFVPIRKKGKLPADTLQEEYSLEYGLDVVEIHKDAVEEGMNVLLVDDLLATGGTAAASVQLIKKLGAKVMAAVFLIELDFLNGRDRLKGVPLHVLINFNNE